MSDRATHSDNSRASTPDSIEPAPRKLPIKCLMDVTDLRPSAFAHPRDGRQRKHLCSLRKAVAGVLARYANRDGSSSYPKVTTIANAVGCDRATVFRLLKDLRELGFLTDGKLAWRRGPRKRTLHVAKMQAALEPDLFSVGVASSPGSESHLRNVEVASSPGSESHLRNVGVASSRQTGPSLGPPLGPEGKERVPDLPCLARRLLEQIHLPITPANLTAVTTAIEAMQKQNGQSYPECCEWLAARVAAARKAGARVNRFWFEDAKYNEPSGGTNGKQPNRAEKDLTNLLDARNKARRAVGLDH